MSPGENTAKSNGGMLMIGPGPPALAALAVCWLTYGFEAPSNSGSRKFVPVAVGVGPADPYGRVPGWRLVGTM